MLDILRRLLGRGTAPADRDIDSRTAALDVRVAACVLLVELASVDDDFSAVERERLVEMLQREFSVDRDGANSLIAQATAAKRGSTDDFVFTHQLVREYDLPQRLALVELMWQVVLADGVIDHRESYLMRKLGKLLQLDGGALADARLRVEQRT